MKIQIEDKHEKIMYSGNIDYNTIGEGVVYICEEGEQRYIFKSKGVKHQKSKVKTLKPVDNEKVKSRMDVVEKVTPKWRLEQFLTDVCDLNNGGQIHRSKIADFIRAVIDDIVKEDLDILANNGVELKEISKYVSCICRDYFFEQEKI